jgi:glutamyl-tRNA synthetase
MIIESMIERITFVKDIITNSPYFFEAPVEYDETVIAKRWKENSAELLEQLKEEYLKIEAPVKEDYENALRKVADANEVSAGKIIHPLRLAVSGVGGGPGLFDITAIIGKDETVRRIESAIKKIKIG